LKRSPVCFQNKYGVS